MPEMNMTDRARRDLEEKYWTLAAERTFDRKKEYVSQHPELCAPESLLVLDTIIEGADKMQRPRFRLLRNLLREIPSRGIDVAFLDYGYVQENEMAQFLGYVNGGMTASSLISFFTVGEFEDLTKIKLLNWYTAIYPCTQQKLEVLRIGLGVSRGGTAT